MKAFILLFFWYLFIKYSVELKLLNENGRYSIMDAAGTRYVRRKGNKIIKLWFVGWFSMQKTHVIHEYFNLCQSNSTICTV